MPEVALAYIPIPLPVDITPPKNVGYIELDVGSTPTPISSESKPCKQVILRAWKDNTDVIYVSSKEGAEAGKGFELGAGDSITIPIDDLSKIYVWTPTEYQKLDVFYVY